MKEKHTMMSKEQNAKNTASLGFEQKIWEAADTLRGNLNAAEYAT